MKKNFFAIFAVVVLGVGILGGCGKSNEIELFSSKAENKEILQQLVDSFNESHPDTKIVITAPADAGTVLKTRLAKNDIPDIVALGGDNNYKELQSAGVLADLSGEDFVTKVQDSYLQMVYDVNADKEQVAYGIPYATNASGVLYNVDKFEKLGLSVPKTWDEFMTVVDKIEAANEVPFLLTYKDSWTGLCSWNSMAPDLQPEGFTDDRLINKTTFISTHQEIAQKYLEILSHAQEDFMGTTYDDGNKAFASGEAYMMINGNWAINQFITANADFKVDMFAFPASNDPSRNFVTSGVDVLFGAAKDSKNLDVAKEFIAYMLEKENAQTYIDDQFAFSAVKGVEQKNPTVAGVKEDIAAGKVANFPDHYYPNGFDLSALLSEFSLNYVNGVEDKENIQTFLTNCDEKYDIANVD
ncbi:ABC transporter substrate-binding protein [Candidatus Galacturonibacter soehngenii]|uniref:Extracellular solute-binding protein n=1 Tax=Candidatus Galacturonatibacter soehngenii TaxID=2307010 RepID=A0A7V7UFR7_9FIRM|nr:extracellular solute-binding protein [Candidatus Galacturonibacter soehngenii]KAB1437756.1 extracellular solute-binding protein [Candidatus Galacturonibacter soehngenii]MBA4688801.1 extracellular solute-binding protein [Candidatus Galacturonibacter soehngenii]